MVIAIVRVRGVHGVTHRIRYALDQMHLTRKNHCVLVEKPDPKMLQQIRDYATWGEASKETVEALKKRDSKSAVYRLNNPVGGWKDTRNHYPRGDLGARGEKINELIKKMLH
ncbi:MAG: uL30 family ribosomal protein [Candidatus Norongarragalinales archaeon]